MPIGLADNSIRRRNLPTVPAAGFNPSMKKYRKIKTNQ
jgi:uncharacterized protein (DUF2344 family)